ncbi:hypothetical protein HJG60_008859 [Phyllostomus discolor]|uniref:Uncharacterized protein n=1 Tax=Phyllostomus discolor TaxID=89673 RepID=A0A833YWF2_9CHIR|nr:hypothetical protein HJG60_008859 [Phyllostomus discolor]
MFLPWQLKCHLSHQAPSSVNFSLHCAPLLRVCASASVFPRSSYSELPLLWNGKGSILECEDSFCTKDTALGMISSFLGMEQLRLKQSLAGQLEGSPGGAVFRARGMDLNMSVAQQSLSITGHYSAGQLAITTASFFSSLTAERRKYSESG